MNLEKESLTHKIEDDLAARNRNWDKIEDSHGDFTSHLAETAADDVHGLAWNEPILLTLQNGWTGSVYLAINPGLGLARIYGSMQPGTTVSGTVITSLPSSAYPENYVAVPVYSGGQGASYLGIYINDSGNMAIRQPLSTISNLGTLRFNTLFSF
jgi:hypothetical protein